MLKRKEMRSADLKISEEENYACMGADVKTWTVADLVRRVGDV
jgi:hypothetical protein